MKLKRADDNLKLMTQLLVHVIGADDDEIMEALGVVKKLIETTQSHIYDCTYGHKKQEEQ